MTKASFKTVVSFILAIIASALAINRLEDGLWIRGLINTFLWIAFTTVFVINYYKLPDK